MPALRTAAVAVGIAALLWLRLDSGLVVAERAVPLVSLSLGALGVLFGVGAWAMRVGGYPERAPLRIEAGTPLPNRPVDAAN